MRWTAILAATAVIGLAGPALAQTKPPVVARAEACLRAKVDAVVAVDPGLQSAASFLVSYACAEEVSRAAAYDRNLAVVKMMSGMMKVMPGIAAAGKPAPPVDLKASVDPETGEIIMPSEQDNPEAKIFAAMMPQMGMTASAQLGGDTPPVALRKLAGDLVLQARQRQFAKGR